jgi:SAM-dependent methyltransferase
MSLESPRSLYDSNARDWARSGPLLVSDYTGRPATLALCEPIEGMRVLDLGCGEGYCTRMLRGRGAREVTGVDGSESMIALAARNEAAEPLGIAYRVGDATNLSGFDSNTLDLVLAMFLFNYLSVRRMRQAMLEVFRVLQPGGRLVFAVPHPVFPFMRSQKQAPFYLDAGDAGYFSGRDNAFSGKIWRRDGVSLDVLACHKIFTDYVDALRSAGFEKLPRVRELTVEASHVELDPTLFSPLIDVPLHMAWCVVK